MGIAQRLYPVFIREALRLLLRLLTVGAMEQQWFFDIRFLLFANIPTAVLWTYRKSHC
jgi:hypothetical protein